jgi:hypothetical protein
MIYGVFGSRVLGKTAYDAVSTMVLGVLRQLPKEATVAVGDTSNAVDIYTLIQTRDLGLKRIIVPASYRLFNKKDTGSLGKARKTILARADEVIIFLKPDDEHIKKYIDIVKDSGKPYAVVDLPSQCLIDSGPVYGPDGKSRYLLTSSSHGL